MPTTSCVLLSSGTPGAASATCEYLCIRSEEPYLPGERLTCRFRVVPEPGRPSLSLECRVEVLRISTAGNEGYVLMCRLEDQNTFAVSAD